MGLTTKGASAGFSAGSAYKDAEIQKMSLRANAWIATNNAQIAKYQASQALVAGQAQEEDSRLQEAQVYGKERAGMAANGVDLGQGSANDVLTSTKVLGDKDALTIHDNALRAAWGYNTEATNYENDALLKRASANTISPGMAAVGSLLGSASSSGFGGGSPGGMTASSGSYGNVTGSDQFGYKGSGGF